MIISGQDFKSLDLKLILSYSDQKGNFKILLASHYKLAWCQVILLDPC